MTKRKASFYAVRVGRTPGVYNDWESCKLQVDGFANSKYKKFGTHAEAESFVNETSSGSQVPMLSSAALTQAQRLVNQEKKQSHFLLPIAVTKRDIDLRSPDKGTSLEIALTSPSSKVTIPKKDVSSSKEVANSKEVAMEDDDFLYFKNEGDLKKFLEPYFQNAKQTSYVQNETFQIEFDGASKGNPGSAGAGALIRCPHGFVVLEVTAFLGCQTNNFAEYQALILGLRAALSKGIRRVRAQGDSKLVCLQVTDVWKVENEKLKHLHQEVKSLLKLFDVFSINHVRREHNSEADALANKAVVHGEAIHEVVKSQPGCCLLSF